MELAVDCVVFREDPDWGEAGNPELQVLLVRRGVPPFKSKWALPGGFVRDDETVEEAAVRELHEETALKGVFLKQLQVFSEPARDPRRRVVSVAFTGTVTAKTGKIRPQGDARDAAWFAVSELPPLAFDHQAILAAAQRARLENKLHAYRYPRAALTVDCVVFGVDEDTLKVLLIQRKAEPFANRWALPGGFVGIDETVQEAAERELAEETGMRQVFLEQLYTFGEPLDRDPRERVVTVAYLALLKPSDHRPQAATDAAAVDWYPLDRLPALAFDHGQIVEVALERLRGKIRYQPIGFELLPPKFTLAQLQRLYEVVLGRPLDKRNFRKKVLAMGILKPLKEFQTGVPHRAARFYQFDKAVYRRQQQEGLVFSL
jgi:8-oxo-dGTP diphosphatase